MGDYSLCQRDAGGNKRTKEHQGSYGGDPGLLYFEPVHLHATDNRTCDQSSYSTLQPPLTLITSVLIECRTRLRDMYRLSPRFVVHFALCQSFVESGFANGVSR